MAIQLKKVKDQVLLITGASSGIGLATAKMAIERGAKVALLSRNKEALDKIASDLGESALAIECDVTDANAIDRAAEQTIAKFGRIDTWVNNAGATIYAKLWESPIEEKRQLFETNFWGVVFGCRSALKYMKEEGGAIINIGSVLSERVIPMQGMYCASKHAVKAYTDALRMEVEADHLPFSVSLVKPAAIDTPYPDHAINHMEHHPTHTPPVYAPEVVARAILGCAESPTRDVFAGGAGKMYSILESFVPRLMDLVMEKTMMEKAQSDADLDDRPQEPVLHGPASETAGKVSGEYQGHVMKTSAYTSAVMNPGKSALIAAGIGLAAAVGIGLLQKQKAAGRRPVPADDSIVRH